MTVIVLRIRTLTFASRTGQAAVRMICTQATADQHCRVDLGGRCGGQSTIRCCGRCVGSRPGQGRDGAPQLLLEGRRDLVAIGELVRLAPLRGGKVWKGPRNVDGSRLDLRPDEVAVALAERIHVDL